MRIVKDPASPSGSLGSVFLSTREVVERLIPRMVEGHGAWCCDFLVYRAGVRYLERVFLPWCLLFILIRQGLQGGPGPHIHITG